MAYILISLLVFFSIHSYSKGAPLYNPLPKFLMNPVDCPLNACEVVKIFVEHLFNAKIMNEMYFQQFHPVHDPRDSTEEFMNIQHWEKQRQLETRVLEVERRLRSVEQPIWKVISDSEEAWDACTEGICRCQAAIKSLSCWRTGMNALPVLQVVPHTVLKIDLSSNMLSTLNKDSFEGMTHLKDLDMSNNLLDYLPFDIFHDLDSLQILRLQKNGLEQLHPKLFLKLRNLKIIDGSSNQIHILSFDLFHSVRKITAINLSSNKIEAMPDTFLKEAIDLEEFDISNNKIKQILKGSFIGLSKLRYLILGENVLETIDHEVFQDLISLEKLSLRNNYLTFIPEHLFDNLKRLVKLDLSQNRIKKINSKAFLSLIKLEDLNLGQNHLASVSKGLFYHLKKLEKLALYSNNFTYLGKETFDGLINVTNLLLNNNNLRDFDPQIFVPLINLRKVRLDSNKLQSLPSNSLSESPNLIAVKLDKNPWHCDCRAIYLARWLRVNGTKLWDGEPTCRGPGDLGGQSLAVLRFNHICEGQWASMVSLSPRLPIRKQILPGQFDEQPDFFSFYETSTENMTITSTTISPVYEDY